MALVLSGLLSTSGCHTSHINMEILQAAEIDLPQEVHNIALINRFRPEKGKGFLNVLEGVLSGEGVGRDRNGAETSLIGLTETLAGSPRYKIVRPSLDMKGWGRASFPDPIPRDQVQTICRQYETEALVTIEAFDSDAGNSCERLTRTVKRDGEKFTEVYFEAEQWIDVTVGWRLYLADGTLFDEYRMVERVSFDSEGVSEDDAFDNLPDVDYMVQEMGHVTGQSYSMRIAPIFVNISRSYYSRGTTALKLGRDKVRMNDWEGAEEHWDMALTNEKEKIRGRAMFNKALAAEVRGELRLAEEIAVRAYEEFGNKTALRYAETLRFRIQEVSRLERQMEGAR